jgi:hypothetical protein
MYAQRRNHATNFYPKVLQRVAGGEPRIETQASRQKRRL